MEHLFHLIKIEQRFTLSTCRQHIYELIISLSLSLSFQDKTIEYHVKKYTIQPHTTKLL